MNYKIKTEAHCVTVYETKVAGEKAKKPGAESDNAVSFHGNLSQAAVSLYHRLVNEGCSDLEILRSCQLIHAVSDEAVAEVKAVVAAMQR